MPRVLPPSKTPPAYHRASPQAVISRHIWRPSVRPHVTPNRSAIKLCRLREAVCPLILAGRPPPRRFEPSSDGLLFSAGGFEPPATAATRAARLSHLSF